MSKAQKGNKEKKKPKADKNQPKTHVSAYKAAQSQGKPSFNAFARKDLIEAGSSQIMAPLGFGRSGVLLLPHQMELLYFVCGASAVVDASTVSNFAQTPDGQRRNPHLNPYAIAQRYVFTSTC